MQGRPDRRQSVAAALALATAGMMTAPVALADSDAERIRHCPDSDWCAYHRTVDTAWRYSPLAEINKNNVGQLEVAWTYPTTENWQKALGDHKLWSSADVRVDGDRVTMTVTVHAADHYDFNRDASDIATGEPDDENGRFAELGWAKGFDTSGQTTRTVTWTLGDPPGPTSHGDGEEDRDVNGEDDRAEYDDRDGTRTDEPE